MHHNLKLKNDYNLTEFITENYIEIYLIASVAASRAALYIFCDKCFRI